MYAILPLRNTTLLTADMIPLCTEEPVPNSWFSFLLPQKNVYPLTGSVPPALQLILPYIWIVPLKMSLGSLPYTNSFIPRSESHVHIILFKYRVWGNHEISPAD
jgi:hypothetical protein